MTRPISKQQFADLFFAEFSSAPGRGGRCILCGNSGTLDTRGKVLDALGVDCGGEANCICPNGRHLQRMDEADDRREAREVGR